MKSACCKLITLLLLLLPMVATAADNDFDPYTADIEDNIKQPAVSAKNHTVVAAAMAQLSAALKHAGINATTVRSDEVVLVTIPCSELFAPNATELKATAAKHLRPLAPYIRRADNYKVVIAVHSDNTGDTRYADNLTAERATAVDDFFYREGGNIDTGIIPYGLGADEPVASNQGFTNRAANRRVEIYFIPTKEFIDKVVRRKGA